MSATRPNIQELNALFSPPTVKWLIDVVENADYAGSDNIKSIAGLSVSVNDMLYASGANTFSTFTSTSYGRSLLGAETAAEAKALLDITENGITVKKAAARVSLKV